jgi:hypothetical protein
VGLPKPLGVLWIAKQAFGADYPFSSTAGSACASKEARVVNVLPWPFDEIKPDKFRLPATPATSPKLVRRAGQGRLETAFKAVPPARWIVIVEPLFMPSRDQKIV